MRTLPLTNRGLHLPTIVTLGLLTVLVALLASASAVSAQGGAPDTPDRPTGTAIFIAGVDLEWNDVPGADSYDVQLFRNGQWTDLPADGVEIAFYGAGAVISGLDPTATLWFQVRARNAHGSSDWSPFGQMPSTEQFEKGRQPRPENLPASGAPAISGTPLVGETLSADTTGIEDGNGLDRVHFRFQWVSNDGSADTDIAGATDSVYTLAANDEGMTISVRVAFTDRGGYAESLTAVGTEQVASSGQANPAPTPEPAPDLVVIGIDATDNIVTGGSFRVGVTVTNQGDAQSAATTLRWKQLVDGTTTEIGTAAQRALTRPQGSFKSIRLTAPSTPGTSSYWACVDSVAGESDTTNNCSGKVTVTVTNNLATGAPTIGGTAQVSQTLTASTSGISDTDGLTNVSYSYQWLADDTEIAGATSSTYTLQASDNGKAIKVRVTFTDDEGNDETLTSEATATVEAAPNNSATGTPAITGTAQVGETLTADTSGIADADGLANVSYSYQWISNDGNSDTDITGATSSSYTLVANDEGNTIKVRVSFTDDEDNDETLTSAATSSVAAKPNSAATGAPTITGTAQVGETLAADVSGIADADGLTSVSYSYQWISNDGSSDTDITDATGSSYTLVAADEGNTIKVKVSFADDAENDETLTSTATSIVAEEQDPRAPSAPSVIGGLSDEDGVTLQWSVPGEGHDPIGYKILRRVGGSGDFEVYVEDTGTTATMYLDTSVEQDEWYEYKVRAINDIALGPESRILQIQHEHPAPIQIEPEVALSQTQANSEPPSHITVALTEDSSDLNNIVTNFTVTWSDADDCSTNYNAYLNIYPGNEPGHETPGSQLHLGSAAFDSTQISKGLTGVQGRLEGFNVELYCGTDGSGRLISRVDIPSDSGRPKPSTYSSEPPLSALSVSHGTLTPTFNSYTSSYTVPDVANDVTRITITATPKTGYFTNFFEASDGLVLVVGTFAIDANGIVSGLSAGCNRVHYDDLGPLIELTDADLNTPGFQVDLYDGENYVHVRVYPTAYCHPGTGYQLTITRAAGSISSPRPNRPVVGLPYIGPSDSDGRLPTVGWTMSADASRISDRDGWDPATFSYQWLADDVEMSGATSPSYTVTDAELGKTLKVRVSFTDDRGTEESVTSDPTRVVKLPYIKPTGKPIILGKLEVGQTLTADVSSISDPNGMTNATFSYEWVNFLGPVRDGKEYTLVDGDGGRSGLWLRVTYTDDAGHEERVNSDTLGVVAARPNSPATGAPTITGTAQVGETLTADTAGIADADGLANVSYSYQWIFDRTGLTWIIASPWSTYTLVAADEGTTVKVRVSFTDEAGHLETLTSTATETVSFAVQQQRANSPATGAPTITGTAQVGETLTADTPGIADADGLSNVSYSYQWVSNDGTSDTDITGATDSTYTLVAADEGKTIRVRVNFTDDAGYGETLTSAATGPVIAAAGGASGQSDSEGVSYITVEATEDTSDPNSIVTNFTVDWSDADDCSTNYNTYLNVKPHTQPGQETSGSQHHLGSAASDATEITKALTGVQGHVEGFDVEVYCGTDTSGRKLSKVDIPSSYGRPKTGTYSSESPLSALSVSDGTLTPAFRSYTSSYTVPDVANDVTRTTITATPEDGYAVEFYEWSGTPSMGLVVYSPGPWGPPSGLSEDCDPGYRDTLGPQPELTDADSNTAGFQVDLYDGVNYVMLRVYPTAICDIGENYFLGITRAEGSVSLTRPNSLPVGGPGIRGLLRSSLAGGNSRGPSGHPWVGVSLDAIVDGIIDRDGSDTATFSYQWLADDAEITGATGSSYTVTNSDLGKTLKVRVDFTDDRGTEESVTSEATRAVKLANIVPTGKPVILGSLEVGQTLIADVSSISDPNGMTNATLSYEWVNFYGPVRDRDEYTLVDRDGGRSGMWLWVTYTDDAGHEQRVTSESIGVVAPRPNSPATGTPAITGTAQVGETLTADTSGIADADGLTPTSPTPTSGFPMTGPRTQTSRVRRTLPTPW